MPTNKTKGKTMVGAELPDELAAAFRDYVRQRGERIGAVLERAVRREMAFPPPQVPPVVPPLFDVETGVAFQHRADMARSPRKRRKK